MAVKKVNKEAKEENLEVKTDNVEVSEDAKTEENKENELEVSVPETDNAGVSVDTTAVDESKKKDGGVKIKMKKSHKCCIAMKRYDLEEGKTYVVPSNVKAILNRAGLLMPL